MKRTFLIVTSIILFVSVAFSQFPSNVKKISSKPNGTVSVKGNLSSGAIIEDLSWASTSSNACFPGTQNKKFRGNHVLYNTHLPKKAIMKITVIPDSKTANFSLYAYQIGTTNYSVVPNLASCVTCEADHKWDYKKAGKTQDHTRSVSVNATTHEYNIVIGVVGADGLKTGGYTLKIEIEGGEEVNLGAQAEVKVNKVTVAKGSTASVKGNLANGVVIKDLSWAWTSSNACFPETQKKKFTGNHVLYNVDLPKYSILEVTVVPDNPKANFSIYTYQIGATSSRVVPDLPSCVACEAEHKWDYKKAGKTQDHTRTIGNITAINNPYKVYVGVVGADGLKSGGYTLKFNLKAR